MNWNELIIPVIVALASGLIPAYLAHRANVKRLDAEEGGMEAGAAAQLAEAAAKLVIEQRKDADARVVHLEKRIIELEGLQARVAELEAQHIQDLQIIARLEAQRDEDAEEIIELKTQVRNLKGNFTRWKAGVRLLIDQIENSGQTPVWKPDAEM